MSRAMFAALSKFYAWLIGRDLVDRSPMIGLAKPKAPASRARVLSDDEIRTFWTATEALGEPFAPLFRLLLLTGQRLNEVAGMRRAEIEGDVWRIPASRAKNHREHFLPLGALARAIIAEAPGDDLVFSTTGRTAVSGFSKAKARLDALMGEVAPWRLHDLRRTMAMNLAALGVAPVVTEKALNHVSGVSGGLVGVYQRFDYAAEVRAAVEAWEKRLEEIVG
jgi:integrase